MMMIMFNHLALLNRQPLPDVPADKRDAFWVTPDHDAQIVTPALYREHLNTQRDMESKVAEMRERGDHYALRPVSYSRARDGRTGWIRFD